MKNNQITDKYELYSYSIYLYLYAFFYLYLFEQTLLKIIIINFFGNILFYYIFNNSILHFINHSYWKYHINDIAMPQLISCITNITINKNLTYFENHYDYIIIIPLNIVIYSFIKKMYKDEMKESKNIRLITSFFFFVARFIFS
jgi:hypothetical protein